MVGAPFVVSKMRLWDENDLKIVQSTLPVQRTAEEIEFLTSIYSGNKSLLVEIRAVSNNYPLLGQVELSNSQWKEALKPRHVVVYPEVLAELGMRTGETLKIGAQDFIIVDTVKQDPGFRRFGTGLSPRIYITKEDLQETGLLQLGSQLTQRLYLETTRDVTKAELKDYSQTLAKSDLFLRSARESLLGLERALGFYQKNLNILSLLLLTLTFATLFYLLQIFYGNRSVMAAQLSLWGVSRSKLGLLFLLQTSILFLMGLGLSILTTKALFYFGYKAVSSLLPEDFQLALSGFDILQTAIVGWLLWYALSFSIFRKWDFLNVLHLFSAETPDTPNVKAKDKIQALAVALFPLFILAYLLTREWKLALSFCGSFFVAMLVVYFVMPFILQLVQKRISWGSPLSKFIFINLSRPRWLSMLAQSALFCFIFIEIFLIHSFSSLSYEFKSPEAVHRPDLFLININASDINPIEKFAKERGGELKFVSPFLQGRLKTLNGATPENENFQKFPLRLSYRKELIESEKNVEFLSPSKQNKDYVPLSVEIEYAERSNLNLGDLLVFDIQGMPVQGQIVSLRSVKWNSFQPNFFIQFPPGVLEDFPQSFIGVIYGWNTDKKKDYSFELSRTFPGISIIDIGFAVNQALSLTEKLLKPLMFLFVFSGLVIMILYFFLLDHFLLNRKPEFNLLSELGADKPTRKRLLTGELVLQTGTTSVVAALCSCLGLWLLFTKWLKIELIVMWKETLLAFLILSLVSFWIGTKRA